MSRLIIIGPVAHAKYPSSIGGASRLFEVLIEYIKKSKSQAIVIPINKFNLKFIGKILNMIYIFIILFIKVRKYEVIMINVSQGGILNLFPLMFRFSKIMKKKLVIRAFGSDLLETIEKSSRKRKLLMNLKKTDLVLVESKDLVSKVREYNTNVIWFPNCRKRLDYKPAVQRSFNKKFVFIGQVKISKGVNEILEVFDQLPDNYYLEIYGPVVEEKMSGIKNDKRYKGVLNPEQVIEVLKNSDILLLPTWYEGEGYPGVIIEAYNMGVPCITTYWRQIPEIVEQGKTGILIKPQSIEELKKAVLSIDQQLFEKLSEGAMKKASEFDETQVHKRIFQEMDQLSTKTI